MAILDLVILGVIAISVIVGLMRGFTKELMSIAAWSIALYLAFISDFYQPVSEYLITYIKQQLLSDVAGRATIFVASLFLLSMVGYIISKAVSATGIKGTDRVLGAVLGLVRGVLIISVFVVVAGIFNVKGADWWNNSKFISHFTPVADAINAVLPKDLQLVEADDSAASTTPDSVLKKAASDIILQSAAPSESPSSDEAQ